MPLDLVQKCPDPGINSNALVALAETRQALAECRQRHQDAVQFYHDTKIKLEGGL